MIIKLKIYCVEKNNNYNDFQTFFFFLILFLKIYCVEYTPHSYSVMVRYLWGCVLLSLKYIIKIK